MRNILLSIALLFCFVVSANSQTTPVRANNQLVNAQTGTTYAIQANDAGKLITACNSSAQAYSIAQAGSTGFPAGYFVDVKNICAGTLVVNPTTSTIDGATATTVTTGQSIRITSNGTNYVTGLGGPSATKNYVDSAVATVAGTIPKLNAVSSGGTVIWESAYTFRVSAATYYINGNLYSSAEQTITLTAAHATLDRIDVLALNTSGTLVKITGTAASQPSEPDIDPSTQLKLTFVFVAANTSQPTGVSNENVYLENTEWTSSTSGSGWSASSTSNPRTGTKDIEGTSVANGAYVQLQRSAPTALDTFGTLSFFIRSKSDWNANRTLRIQFFSSGVSKGNALTIASSYWGFDASQTSSYQLIAIALNQFAIPAGTTVNQIRITDVGGSIGLYIDDIVLQALGTTVSPPVSTGITISQGDARYAQRANNLSDVANAASAINNILPTQTSNSGKYLTTNGSVASWGTVSAASVNPTDKYLPYNNAGTFADSPFIRDDANTVSMRTGSATGFKMYLAGTSDPGKLFQITHKNDYGGVARWIIEGTANAFQSVDKVAIGYGQGYFVFDEGTLFPSVNTGIFSSVGTATSRVNTFYAWNNYNLRQGSSFDWTGFVWNGSSRIISYGDGQVSIDGNSDNTAGSRLFFGVGGNSGAPMLKRNSAKLEVKLADDSAYTEIIGTIDTSTTGTTLTQPFKIWFPAAGCSNTTAASFWDLPTATPAVAACVTGTNIQKGVLQFADTSGGFSAQNTYLLPADWTGNIDARIIWRTSATSGNAKFSLSFICTDVAATATDDPAFNTASTVTTAAPGTTLQIQTSSITSATITGCTAGSLLHMSLFRDGNDAADTIAASLDVIGVELTIRRAQ